MKLVIFIFMFLNFSAFAAWNEVECEGTSGAKSFSFEIEQPIPYGSVFKKAHLFITEEGKLTQYDYIVSSQVSRGFNSIRYAGAGLSLKIDLWPDRIPQWGRFYRSELRSSDLSESASQNVPCNFPNAL